MDIDDYVCEIICKYEHKLGWRWLSDENWQIDMSPNNIDDEGWSYAVNFGEFKDLDSGMYFSCSVSCSMLTE